MPEFFIFSCQECGSKYPGMLEVTESRDRFKLGEGYCGDCLERLYGIDGLDERAENREGGLGTSLEG